MSAKFPCVSKRPIVPGIIELPKFNYEDLGEILAGGQGSFGVYWHRKSLHTYAVLLRYCFYCLFHTSFQFA